MPDPKTNDWAEAIANAPIGVFRTKAKGGILYANQELAKMFAFDSVEELIEQVKDISKQLFDPKQREDVLALLDEHGQVRDFVYEARAKDKTRRFVSFSARKVADDGGTFFYEGFMHDITEQKLAENRLNSILGEIQGMAYQCEPVHPWKMQWVSDGCRDLTGYRKEDIEKQAPIYGDLIWDTHQGDVAKTVEEGIDKNTTFTLIYPIRTSNKEKKWVFERGRAVRDERNKVIHLEGVIQNYNEDRDWYQRERQEMEIRNLRLTLYLRRAMWWAVIVVFSLANLTMLGIAVGLAAAGNLGEQSFVYCFGATVLEMATIAVLIGRYLFTLQDGPKPPSRVEAKHQQKGEGKAESAGDDGDEPKPKHPADAKPDGEDGPYPHDFRIDPAEDAHKPKPKKEKAKK